MNNNQVLTGSGDLLCISWDIEKQEFITRFTDYTGDVEGIGIHFNPSIPISASIDSTAKLWNIRTLSKAQVTYMGHESDLNCCRWFSNQKELSFIPTSSSYWWR